MIALPAGAAAVPTQACPPQVRPLHDDPPALALVDEWLRTEWPGLRAHAPQRWIAHHDGRPAGVAGLAHEDDPLAPGTLPCLVELYVPPAARGRGVGRALCEHLAGEARRHGWPALWLFTRDRAAFFEARGWRELMPVVRQTRLGLEWVTWMRLELDADPPAATEGSGSTS